MYVSWWLKCVEHYSLVKLDLVPPFFLDCLNATCNSCLMVFTVYGICTARGWYYPMHCKNHETADLYR